MIVGVRTGLTATLPAAARGNAHWMNVSLFCLSMLAELRAGAEDYSLYLGVGPVLELTRTAPFAYPDSSAFRPEEPALRASPLARASFRGETTLLASFMIFAAASFDYDLLRTRYQIDTGDERRTVIEPWLVRPSLLLGLGWRAPR
jgi:hypothetical protein